MFLPHSGLQGLIFSRMQIALCRHDAIHQRNGDVNGGLHRFTRQVHSIFISIGLENVMVVFKLTRPEQ